MPRFHFEPEITIDFSVPAIAFAVLYGILLISFALKSRTHPSYFHYIITFFCAIQTAAFAIHASLDDSSPSASGDLDGLIIADNILFPVGYFSLLFSAYILVLDRILLSDLPPPKNPLLKISQNRWIFLIALLVGLILSIISSTNTSTTNILLTINVNRALYITSVAIFLLLTLVQAFQTIILASSGIFEQSRYYARARFTAGIRYGNYIFLTIPILLLIRGAFEIAAVEVTTINLQLDERFWYPFTAVTEFLVVLLYTIPGLVPWRDELRSHY